MKCYKAAKIIKCRDKGPDSIFVYTIPVVFSLARPAGLQRARPAGRRARAIRAILVNGCL